MGVSGRRDILCSIEAINETFNRGNKMETKILHDDFGNTATIFEKEMLPYRGATKQKKSYVLSLTADYEMDFLYFRSVYESLEELNAQLEKFSCGTWK